MTELRYVPFYSPGASFILYREKLGCSLSAANDGVQFKGWFKRVILHCLCSMSLFMASKKVHTCTGWKTRYSTSFVELVLDGYVHCCLMLICSRDNWIDNWYVSSRIEIPCPYCFCIKGTSCGRSPRIQLRNAAFPRSKLPIVVSWKDLLSCSRAQKPRHFPGGFWTCLARDCRAGVGWGWDGMDDGGRC